jgi:hypothetical protein
MLGKKKRERERIKSLPLKERNKGERNKETNKPTNRYISTPVKNIYVLILK